jgi:hypothetical protein
MSKELLIKYSKSINIAEHLSEDELGAISKKCNAGYELDLDSSLEWFNKVEDAQKLASLKKEPKTINGRAALILNSH